ncbi:hypothetical protein [Jiangella mangrovi]|uniref:Uncharacterized protein n=1 Tax=Jiangella mangrovi TaxID=1524084 RepID=A0A7W9GX32_9ACTN|nr:hypothetical protein [Jiangella mangrovi]MBB5791364.1 hypothetical protein [Jiangella mangrovi]
MTPFDDDELARALARVPVGTYASLDSLQNRAHQLHVRRRLTGAGVAAAAAVAVGIPSALALTSGDGGTPTPADDPAHCPVTYDDRLTSIQPIDTWAQLARPDMLPPSIRLLWDESAAPPPTEASAFNNSDEAAALEAAFEQCPPPDDLSVVVVQSAGGVVERRVLVMAVGQEREISDVVRTIDAGAAEILIESEARPLDGLVTAWWHDADGMTWYVAGSSLTDDELVELVQTMGTVGDEIDLSAWSVAQDAEQIIQHAGVGDRPATYAYSATVQLDGGTPQLQLMVDDDNRTLWIEAMAGTREVDVAGVPGLLSDDGGGTWRLSWQLDPATTTILYGADDPEELLAIAATVGRVPGGDSRLLDAWKPQ